MVQTNERPRLLLPGFRPPDPFLETYLVRPGGATVIMLRGGDRLTVSDRDGVARAEVTALAPGRGEDPGALGMSVDAPGTVLRSLAGSGADGAQDIVDPLAASG